MEIFIIYWLSGSLICSLFLPIFVCYLSFGLNLEQAELNLEQAESKTEQVEFRTKRDVVCKNNKLIKSHSTNFIAINTVNTNESKLLHDLYEKHNESSISDLSKSLDFNNSRYNSAFKDFMKFYIYEYYDSDYKKLDGENFIVYIHHHYYKYFDIDYISKFLGIDFYQGYGQGQVQGQIGVESFNQIKMVISILPKYIFYIKYRDTIIFRLRSELNNTLTINTKN